MTINTPELIRQGISRMDDITWPLEVFKDPVGRLRLIRPAKEAQAMFTLSPSEQTLLGKIASGATLRDLCAPGNASHFPLLKFLWALFILGVLAQGGPSAAAKAQTDAEPEDLGLTGDDLKSLK